MTSTLIASWIKEETEFTFVDWYKHTFTFQTADAAYQIEVKDSLEHMYRWHIQANVPYVIAQKDFGLGPTEGRNWIHPDNIVDILKRKKTGQIYRSIL